MDERVTDAEVKELNNIADVLQRVQQAMTKINELMGCQAPSKLASAALDAQFICAVHMLRCTSRRTAKV